MAVIEEQEYDFLLNTAGELMLVFYGLEAEPKNSTLHLMDKYVLLDRAAGTPQVRMDDVPEEIWTHLKKVPKVLVCEIDDDGEFKHVYDTSVVKS